VSDDAGGVIERANQERLVAGDTLLTIAKSVVWLAHHGIDVHENTVRHWCKSGRITVVRRQAQGKRGGGKRPEILIALETLTRMAACPYCTGR
jgi:hypothetical protein